MAVNLTAFISGVLFAVGLGLAGMTQPAKVINFLDFFGSWDPSLAFVMVGAISVHLISYRFIKHRESPFFHSDFHLPTRDDVDRNLVIGSALFGIGWGIGGFCPGPAIASLVTGFSSVWIFLVCMTAGMVVCHFLVKPGAS